MVRRAVPGVVAGVLVLGACGERPSDPAVVADAVAGGAAFEPCGGLTTEVARRVVDRPVRVTAVPELPGAGTCLVRTPDASVLVQVIGSSRDEDLRLPLADPALGESAPIEVPGADEALVAHSEDDGGTVTSVHARTDGAVHSVIGVVDGADRDEHVRIEVALLAAVLDVS